MSAPSCEVRAELLPYGRAEVSQAAGPDQLWGSGVDGKVRGGATAQAAA